MKKIALSIAIIIAAALGVFLLTTKTAAPLDKKDTVEIAVTVFPIYDIARIIAGTDASVHLIVPPGTSPHAFDASAQTIKRLSGSAAIFGIGHGVDDWVASVQHALPNTPFITVDKGIVLRESEHEEEGHEEEAGEHGPIDPHYWLSPDNAKTIAATIADELSRIDGAHAAAYNERKNVFIEEIEKQDALWQARLAPFAKRDILTFHDAFYYFADHFNLHVVATYEPFVGKEPSPQYLAALHDIVKEYDIRTLFIEPQLSRSGLDAFAADIGASIGVLDEMGGAEGKESYIALIDANVREVEKALQRTK